MAPEMLHPQEQLDHLQGAVPAVGPNSPLQRQQHLQVTLQGQSQSPCGRCPVKGDGSLHPGWPLCPSPGQGHGAMERDQHSRGMDNRQSWSRGPHCHPVPASPAGHMPAPSKAESKPLLKMQHRLHCSESHGSPCVTAPPRQLCTDPAPAPQHQPGAGRLAPAISTLVSVLELLMAAGACSSVGRRDGHESFICLHLLELLGTVCRRWACAGSLGRWGPPQPCSQGEINVGGWTSSQGRTTL